MHNSRLSTSSGNHVIFLSLTHLWVIFNSLLTFLVPTSHTYNYLLMSEGLYYIYCTMPGIIGVNKAKDIGHITTDCMGPECHGQPSSVTWRFTHYLGTSKILFTGHTEHKTPQTSPLLRTWGNTTLVYSRLSCVVLTTEKRPDAKDFLIASIKALPH